MWMAMFRSSLSSQSHFAGAKWEDRELGAESGDHSRAERADPGFEGHVFINKSSADLRNARRETQILTYSHVLSGNIEPKRSDTESIICCPRMAVSWRWVVLCCHHLSPNHSVSKRIKSTKQTFIAALFASHFGFGSRCIKTIKIPKFICFIFINFWSFVCTWKINNLGNTNLGKNPRKTRMKNPPAGKKKALTQAFGSGLLNARDPGRGTSRDSILGSLP